MKKYPTITVFVVIAVHVVLSWSVYHLAEIPGDFSSNVTNGIGVGAVPLPAILLGTRTSLSFLSRTLLLFLSLEGITFRDQNDAYAALVLFTLILLIISSLFAFLSKRRLEREDFDACQAIRPQTFSLKQLLATMTLVAIVIATSRSKLDQFIDLYDWNWEPWLLCLFLAAEMFLTCTSVFFQWRSACKTLLVALVLVAIKLFLFHEDAWEYAVTTMATAVNAALPAIALRLCGWRWVRVRPSEMPRPETTEPISASGSQDTNP